MRKVVKFGGSSLANAEQFKKVGEIIHSDPARVYVVPSAPGKRFSRDTKVTDMLYDCYAAAEAGEDIVEKLEKIHDRYKEIIEGLRLRLDLSGEFEMIKANFEEKAGKDYAASRGEYLNGIIMATYLGYSFLDAASVVKFDKEGNFDDELTDRLLAEKLEEVEKAVIPGFYGSMPDGSIKTFSRGGSDITGSIVAKAANVDIYENWTDVSGVMIADPRIIDNPVIIHTITYKELRELAYMGASVLHDEAIFPVRKAGIPINIRNTNAPEDEGTMIVENTSRSTDYVITGIAGKKEFVAIDIEKDMMNTEVGLARKVLSAFEKYGISFEHLPSGIDTISVIVNRAAFEAKEQEVLAYINRIARPDTVTIDNDMALIAVVGRGMKSQRGTAGRIFSALAHAHVNVKMIDQGSSELNIIIGVSACDFEKAIKAIYDIFVTIQL